VLHVLGNLYHMSYVLTRQIINFTFMWGLSSIKYFSHGSWQLFLRLAFDMLPCPCEHYLHERRFINQILKYLTYIIIIDMFPCRCEKVHWVFEVFFYFILWVVSIWWNIVSLYILVYNHWIRFNNLDILTVICSMPITLVRN